MKNFKRRLAVLEEAAKLRRGPTETRCIVFVGPDGREVEATFAKGPGGFVCHRGADEELAAFKDRADEECRATRPRVPPILVFLRGETSDVPLR
jgi:hypothetical protein